MPHLSPNWYVNTNWILKPKISSKALISSKGLVLISKKLFVSYESKKDSDSPLGHKKTI